MIDKVPITTNERKDLDMFSLITGALATVGNSITGLKDVYTTDEVVRILGISKPTLFKKVKEDKIRPYGNREAGSGRIGYRFKREEIEKFGKIYNIEPDWSAVIDESSFDINEFGIKNLIMKNALETYQLELRQLKLTVSADENSKKENELKEISIRLKIKELKGILLSEYGLLEKRLRLLYSDFDSLENHKTLEDYENFKIEHKKTHDLLYELHNLAFFADAIEKGEQKSYEEYVEIKDKKFKEEVDKILEEAKKLDHDEEKSLLTTKLVEDITKHIKSIEEKN